MKTEIVVVLDNVRSMHNVGAILRTCDVFGIKRLLCCGITPYPSIANDTRLPHIARRATQQITKASLGAEKTVTAEHHERTIDALTALRAAGFQIVSIEQTESALLLERYSLQQKTAVILGNEVDGVGSEALEFSDEIVEIEQYGTKESLNVAASAAIVLHQFATKA